MTPPLCERVRLDGPLRGVRRRWPATWDEFQARIKAAEQVAEERGRHAAERFLGDQMVQQRASLLELQNGVLQSLRNLLPQVAAETEGALIELACSVARKLVEDVPLTAETIAAAVREALAQADQSAVCCVQLHPEDLRLLQSMNAPLLLTEMGGGRVQFESGAMVSRGGCLVQTTFGLLDARRETKAALLESSLRGP